jgi:hypothetical protein
MSILYNLLDGTSTGFMLLGFILAHGTQNIIILNMYLAHWFISFCYHMYSTKTLYLADTLSIQLLVCERIHAGLGPYWGNFSRIFFISNPIINKFINFDSHNYTVFFISYFTFVYLYFCKYKLLYLFSMLSSGIFFYISYYYCAKNNYTLASVHCIIYHFYQGLASYIEGPYYNFIHNDITQFLRYLTYFSFTFMIAQKQKIVNYRLQSVISLSAATLLAPIGCYEVYTYFTDYNNYINTYTINYPYRRETILFYLTYAFADTVYGNIYYPEYFPMLEGWIHHLFSSAYAIYCLNNNNATSCLAMIVEIPSIILFSSKVFNNNKIISYSRKKIFPYLFILFRVIILWFIVMNLYNKNLLELNGVIVFHLFALLNLYWWSIMMKIKFPLISK